MSGSILLVDDESNVRAAITRLLRGSGYKVFAVESARQAFEIALNEKLDLVLFDIHLGDLRGSKIDGLELCRNFKLDTRTQNIPVIMLTAHGDLQHVLASKKAGADDFIVKPWESEKLLAKIQSHLPSAIPEDFPESNTPANEMEETAPRMRKRGSGLASQRALKDDPAGQISQP